MARPKKTVAVVEAPSTSPAKGHTIEQGANGMWLVRFNGVPQRSFASESEAKKFVDYVSRVK